MTNPCFPAKGQRARVRWLPEDPGDVIQAGPEQSVLRHDHDKRERVYANTDLEPAPTRRTPRRKAA